MFYMLERQSENQCNIGDEIMVLADFTGIKAGEKGRVVEIYSEGITIEWDKDKDSVRPQADGFNIDEFEYLRFKTNKHPKKM